MCIFFVASLDISAQNWHKKTDDGRFIVELHNLDPVANIDYDVYHGGLIKNFSVGVEWWTLLGEPIELYQVAWYSSGTYRFKDGRSLSRSQLEKYPDLVKRFEAVRPLDIELRFSGKFNGEPVKAPPHGMSMFYKYGGAAADMTKDSRPYNFKSEFFYVVDGSRLLPSKSGINGHGIVPAMQPKGWRDFLQYKALVNYHNLAKDNYSNYYSDLSQDEQKQMDRALQKIFRESKEIDLTVSISKLAWPVMELESILERYNQYEKGAVKPPPIEIVNMELEKEKLIVSKDDFWGVPEVLKKPELEVFKSGEKYGVRYKGTQRVVVPANYYSINIDHGFISAKLEPHGLGHWYYHCKPENSNNRILLNSSGEVLISDPFDYASITKDDAGDISILITRTEGFTSGILRSPGDGSDGLLKNKKKNYYSTTFVPYYYRKVKKTRIQYDESLNVKETKTIMTEYKLYEKGETNPCD